MKEKSKNDIQIKKKYLSIQNIPPNKSISTMYRILQLINNNKGSKWEIIFM